MAFENGDGQLFTIDEQLEAYRFQLGSSLIPSLSRLIGAEVQWVQPTSARHLDYLDTSGDRQRYLELGVLVPVLQATKELMLRVDEENRWHLDEVQQHSLLGRIADRRRVGTTHPTQTALGMPTLAEIVKITHSVESEAA